LERIDFTKSIESQNFNRDVVVYFDEVMALYDLVGDYEISSISSYNNSCNMNFNLLFSSEETAKEVERYLNNSEITIYNKTYNVVSNRMDNNIFLNLIKRVSG